MAHAKPLARRPRARLTGDRETRALVALLGGEVKRARLALRLTQQQLADRVGISRARLAEIERGEGHSAPFATWTSLGIALGRPLAASFSRPLGLEEPRDAGHLGAEEYILGLARRVGRDRSLELSVGSGWRPRVIDVVQRDRLQRTLILNEIWNRMDDFGGAIRNHDLKVADLERLAVVAGGEGPPYRVAACWILRATAANPSAGRALP
jgi:transcriptional regulator with XRE-family HTH domain